ncbi:MAG TPA: hypothetical protein VNC11_04255 [Gemmatimonadaceae bacterium]|jgi:hypothetical protein|nr:hypothetical protein [Gemmatimonadaceae bacterium]
MHVTLRWYQEGSALADAIRKNTAEVKKIISDVPGFISYYGFTNGNTYTSVTVCQDKAGTDESTRRAAAWVKENVPEGIQPPAINEGDTMIGFNK